MTSEEFRFIRGQLPGCRVRYFYLLARLSRLFRGLGLRWLLRLDGVLLTVCPWLSHLAGSCVIAARV